MGWWGGERALKWGRSERSRGGSAGAREGECWRNGGRARAHREGERAYFFLYIILTGW